MLRSEKDRASGAGRRALTSVLGLSCKRSREGEADKDLSSVDTDILFSNTRGVIFSLPVRRRVEARQLAHLWRRCRNRFLIGQSDARSTCRKRAKKIAAPCRAAIFPKRSRVRTRRWPVQRTYAVHPGTVPRCCRWSACSAAGQTRFSPPRPTSGSTRMGRSHSRCAG